MSSCNEICSVAYDCGLATCSGPSQLCPAFTNDSGGHDHFVSAMQGPLGAAACQDICAKGADLLTVSPTNCTDTITALKQLQSFALACGAPSTTTSTTTSTSTGMMLCGDPGAPPSASMGTNDCGGATGPGCMMASSCDEVCSAIFDCGLAVCAGGLPECPGFSASAHDAWVTAMGPGSCQSICMQYPMYRMFVTPKDCVSVIKQLKGPSTPWPAFASQCNGGG